MSRDEVGGANEPAIDIGYLVGALRRRWLLIVAPAVVGSALAALVAYVLPPVYVSSARILVESQQIPEELARSTVAVNAAERIQVIEERLKTRRNMLDLEERYEVFADRGEMSPTEIVERMRASLRISVSSPNVQRRNQNVAVTTVTLAFNASRPGTAAQVANDLLTQMLTQNVEQRSARASETRDFFEREVERVTLELEALEERIATFKTENQLALPESLAARQTELSSLQRDLYNNNTRRLSLIETMNALENAIEIGGVEAAGAQPSRASVELADLRSTLAQRRAILSEAHPTIRALRARIDALETEVGIGGAATAGDEDGGPKVGAAAEALRGIERLEAEIGLIDEQNDAFRRRIGELEQALARSGEVGIELGALLRAQASLQAQFQILSEKRAEAVTGERLEINQQAERFEVIETPRPADEPVWPNRILIAGAGGVLSLGFGFGLAVLAELLNPALRNARDVIRRLDVQPLGTIPVILTKRERRRRAWMLRAAVFGIIVILPASLWYVDQQVMPLSLVAEKVMDRFGLDNALFVIQQRF